MLDKDTVKAVIFIEDAINLNHDELKKKFKEAVDNNKINHFEIKTRGKKMINYPCGWFDVEQLPGGSRAKSMTLYDTQKRRKEK